MNDKALTVLVTGAGAPGIAGTIRALRCNPDNAPVRIIAVDRDEAAVGRFLSDAFHVVPPADDPEFVPVLIKVAQEEDADVILPQVTRELEVLAERRHEFEATGVRVVVSSLSAIRQSNDKLAVLIAAESTSVPYPKYRLTANEQELLDAVRSLGYPQSKVVVKPRTSNGMRGLRILTDTAWDVRRFLEEKPEGIDLSVEELVAILRRGQWPELLVTEYLPGDEYTVDVFQGRHVALAIPRLRQQIRSGITFRSRIQLRQDLIDYSLRLAGRLELQYCFGFQFKLAEDGTPKILECNPRVQGTMVASVFAGFNLIYYSIREALGDPIKSFDPARLRDELEFVRYWGGLGIHEGTRFRSHV